MLRILSTLTVWRAGQAAPESVRVIAERLTRRAWRVVTRRNGGNRPWRAHFAASALFQRSDGHSGVR